MQSEKNAPNMLLIFVNEFLEKTYTQFIMSPNFSIPFYKAVEVLTTSLSGIMSHNNLGAMTWEQIVQGKYQFDINKQKLQELSILSCQFFRHFYYNKILQRREQRKLTIVVHGEGKETELNVDCNIMLDRIDQTKTELNSACK